jgi:hypothetical protein
MRHGRNGVGARLLRVLAVGVTLAAGLAASTAPDRLAQQAAEFDRVFAAYQGWFVGERDELGLAYDHWRYDDFEDPVGDRTYDVQIDYARLGRSPDVAVLRRDRNSRPGYGLDVIHPAGSPEDFVLVGDRYREPVSLPEQETLRPPGSTEPLARALWIARPTTLADAGGWDRCATAGTSGTCILDQAIAATRAAVPGVPRTYHRATDGTVTARTAVRLIDLVAYDLAPIGAYQLAVLQPVLYGAVFVVDLIVERDGHASFPRGDAGERDVDDDSGQPGRDLRVAPVGVCRPQRPDAGILDRVRGVFPVAQCPQGQVPQPLPVPHHQLGECACVLG